MRRLSGIAGLVFVVLAIGAKAVRGSVPSTDSRDAPAKFARFYAVHSHSTHALASAVIGLLAMFFFAWFLGGLWSVLREAEGSVTMPTILIAVGGAGFFVMGMFGHLTNSVIGVTLHFDKGYRLDTGLAIVMQELSTGAILAAAMAAGVMTAAAGWLILRTRALPAWIAWIGFVVTVTALPVVPPLAFLGLIVLAVWTTATSVVLLRPTA